MLFGRLLKQIRKRKGYTSQQLADALHVSRSTYSRYENDLKDVEPDILFEPCEFFYDTTVDDFLLWNALIKSPDYPMNVNKLRRLGKLK
ncbi:MAG: helix-turn-helix domain-containing protein [Clostridium sp.]|nr:MAG: helix-turn-helix domain-containing protein [Clostridium sp.]